MPDGNPVELLRELFDQLRRRRFPLGPSDIGALRNALSAGFGWGSRDDLRDLVVALWAKSTREAAVVGALFTRLPWPANWTREVVGHSAATVKPTAAHEPIAPLVVAEMPGGVAHVGEPKTEAAPVTRSVGAVPPLSLGDIKVDRDQRLIFVEQFPLTHREIAQAFRRLRRPLRFGPPVELDVSATVAQRTRVGVPVAPVLLPARRNTSHLLLFVDVEGSMAPYSPFMTAFCDAVREAGWLQRTHTFYFHDLPLCDSDSSLLDDLESTEFFPVLDPLLGRIEPLANAEVFLDEDLTQPASLGGILAGAEAGTVALVVSDAGAVRGRSDLLRLLNSIAFVKTLRAKLRAIAWLNPVPQPLWANTNASQLARHLPMYPLDRFGIHHAVNTLRGQPYQLERPL